MKLPRLLRNTLAALTTALYIFAASAQAQTVTTNLSTNVYAITVLSVHDGDTFKAQVPLWPGLSAVTLVRVLGVDTPELRGRCSTEREAAERARVFTTQALAAARHITLTQLTEDKYGGRIVANVLLDGVSLSERLIAAGLAHSYDGGTKTPWCAPL